MASNSANSEASSVLDALLARFTGADAPPSLLAAGCESRLSGDLAALAAHPQAPHALVAAASIEDSDDFWGRGPDDWRSYFRPYVVRDGMLQIPVKGVLLASCSIAYGSYATGYGYLSRAWERGQADANVRGIALMIDTYGGHVAENFDLVDKMFADRGRKPVRAFAHEHAYSAGYSIASAADQIVVSRTGGVGSIGVVTAHRDVSAAAAAAGVKVTFIHFGAHKVDGNPFEPLPKDVRERMQARIDELGEVFVATIARNRGLAPETVRGTQARTYTAGQAVEAKLADAIGSLEIAVTAFAADLNNLDPGDEGMRRSPAALVPSNMFRAVGAHTDTSNLAAAVTAQLGASSGRTSGERASVPPRSGHSSPAVAPADTSDLAAAITAQLEASSCRSGGKGIPVPRQAGRTGPATAPADASDLAAAITAQLGAGPGWISGKRSPVLPLSSRTGSAAMPAVPADTGDLAAAVTAQLMAGPGSDGADDLAAAVSEQISTPRR